MLNECLFGVNEVPKTRNKENANRSVQHLKKPRGRKLNFWIIFTRSTSKQKQQQQQALGMKVKSSALSTSTSIAATVAPLASPKNTEMDTSPMPSPGELIIDEQRQMATGSGELIG